MKKVYLGIFMILGGAYVSAQVNKSAYLERNNTLFSAKAENSNQAKAEGDVIWSNDFSTPTDWAISNQGAPSHTGGDWAIVSALPSTLTSQAASYGFPSSMNSTSGGNFALIDSDAAGGAAAQNAYITTANGIDVAALLTGISEPTNKALFLQFTEIYRHFQEQNFVEVSNDGGVTWTQFQVNPVAEVPVNTNSGDPEIEIVNITPAIGGGNWSSDVRIRFYYKGQWDWFWGIDDVELIVAYDNDVKLNNFYQAVPTVEAGDYYIIPTSQTSFPGLTFGATALNNGGADQAAVTLNVTSGTYDETSAPKSINSGIVDTLDIATPFMIPATVGDYTINATTEIDSNVDSDPSNNAKSIVVRRDANVYARDNGTVAGAIAQVTSQTDLPLSIGNVVEVFDDMTVTAVQVRLVNQPTAVGQTINAQIEILNADGTDFEYFLETDNYDILSDDLNGFVTLPLSDGPGVIPAGSIVLVMAHHYGGENEVAFGMAQPTYQGSVLGRTADGGMFNLTDPRAIMVRMTSDASVSVDKVSLEGVKVYPNPSTGLINVSNDMNVENTIVVTDLSGKIVTSKVASVATTIDLSTVGTGVYLVEVSNKNGKKVERIVVQ